MNFSRFFVDRPIFEASYEVLSIVSSLSLIAVRVYKSLPCG